MDKVKILDIENDGINLSVDGDFLYMRCKRSMYKYDLTNMQMAAENIIFKKDGRARGFSICDDFIFLHDFLDLYILDKNDLTVKESFRLGENLSSDVCGLIWFDFPKAYLNIRNGWIYILDIQTKEVKNVKVNDSGSWGGFAMAGSHLFYPTVKGELLEIDRDSLDVIRKVNLCKKNIYSVVHEDGLLYMTSQDQTIKIVDAASLETTCVIKKAVAGMVGIIGIHNDNLVIAGNRTPFSFWDKKTLQLRKNIDFPRSAILHKGVLFGSDHQSIYKMIL